MHHILTCAVRWDMMEVSPFSKGPFLLLKENNERLGFLSEDEIDSLLNNCPPYLNHVVTFCIHTGARRQEALNFKWHQIKNGQAYFEQTKTDNPRQVPISDELQELNDQLRGESRQNVINLKGEHLKSEKRHAEHVFLHKGKPISGYAVTHSFITACKRSEIPYGLKTPDGVTFHTTRHTFGSRLAIRGVPIKTIQELMGHRDIKMTMRYAHLAENVKIEGVNVLSGLTDKKNRTCHAGVTRNDFDDSSKILHTGITTII